MTMWFWLSIGFDTTSRINPQDVPATPHTVVIAHSLDRKVVNMT